LATRRHELRPAHRARVGPDRHGRVEFLFASKNQELYELVAEEFRPWRVVKGQSCQSIDDTVSACDSAVVSFNADNAHDHLDGHARFLANALEHLAILEPECGAGCDPFPGQEYLAVLGPGQRLLGGF
jgi:hypothetical protein